MIYDTVYVVLVENYNLFCSLPWYSESTDFLGILLCLSLAHPQYRLGNPVSEVFKAVCKLTVNIISNVQRGKLD